MSAIKFRLDFVTNSSSSSYVCEFCGEIQAGYNLSMDDAGMMSCRKGHTLCEEHFDLPKCWKHFAIMILENLISTFNNEDTLRYQERLNVILHTDPSEFKGFSTVSEQLDDACYYIYEELPPQVCPICSLMALTEKDELHFLEEEVGITNEMVLEEIKRRFGTYDAFKEFLHGRRKR